MEYSTGLFHQPPLMVASNNSLDSSSFVRMRHLRGSNQIDRRLLFDYSPLETFQSEELIIK